MILGSDIATCSGLCWMNTAIPPRDWSVLAVISEGKFREEESTDLGLFFHEQVSSTRPDFVAIEMPRRDVEIHPKKEIDPATGQKVSKGKTTINPNAIKLTGHAAAVCMVLDIAGIPWGLIASVTWRGAYFGKGWTPPDGNWKAAAVERAALQGIEKPVGITKKAWEDVSESVGIASAWELCTQVPARHQKAFLELRTRTGIRRVA